jgi:hypothetical protein
MGYKRADKFPQRFTDLCIMKEEFNGTVSQIWHGSFVAATCAFAIGVPRLASATYLLIKPAFNISFY